MDVWYKLLAKECRAKGSMKIFPTFHDGILDYVNHHIIRYYPIWKEIGLSINNISRPDPYPYPHTHGPWYQSTILEGEMREVRNGVEYLHKCGDTYYVGEEIYHQVYPIVDTWTMMLFHGPTKTTTEFVTPDGVIPAYDVLLKHWSVREIHVPSDYHQYAKIAGAKIVFVNR